MIGNVGYVQSGEVCEEGDLSLPKSKRKARPQPKFLDYKEDDFAWTLGEIS